MSDQSVSNPIPRFAGDASQAAVGRGPQLLMALCVAACVVFGLWAAFGRLAVVSTATGEVVPASQVKTVQHLEGGIVSEILVAEGQAVTRDQPLVVLQSTASGADLGELQVRVTALQLEVLRLEAQAEGRADLDVPEDLTREHPDQVAEARDLLRASRARLSDERAGMDQLIAQRRQDIQGITKRIGTTQATLKLMREQIAISEELLKEDLTNRYNHLNLLKEASELRGQIAQDESALARARAALAEATAQRSALDSGSVEAVRSDLDNARRSLDEYSQRLAKYEDSLRRTVVRSPVDGVVKTLRVVTLGGVLRPGDAVADIVPAGDRLVVEARLPVDDIGYVRAGQKARIKLASADASRFDALDGTVVTVSPDTLVTRDGRPFYKVRLETDQDRFRRGALEYRLFPGMAVSASIHTGQRTVLQYLLDPFMDSLGEALRER